MVLYGGLRAMVGGATNKEGSQLGNQVLGMLPSRVVEGTEQKVKGRASETCKGILL